MSVRVVKLGDVSARPIVGPTCDVAKWRLAEREAAFWSTNHPDIQPLSAYGHPSQTFLSVAGSILDLYVVMEEGVPILFDRERWIDCLTDAVLRSITDDRSALEGDER